MEPPCPTSATPRTTNGCASTARSPRSASREHAQEQLGDVVFVELPEVGRDGRPEGEPMAVVESVKAASDVYAPISGEVVEVNAALSDDPALVNGDAEGAGWFFKLEIAKPAELDGLMDAAAYAPSSRARAEPAAGPVAGTQHDERFVGRAGSAGAFVGRHIGPDEAEIAAMLEVVGAGSLDELIDRTVPAAIRTERPLALPPAIERGRGAGGPARAGRAQPRADLDDRHGLLRHPHAAGDPAQRAREPRLVHGLHALPGRGQPGPARGRCSTSSRWSPT